MQGLNSLSKIQIRNWLGRHSLFWLFYVFFFTIVTLPYNGSFADCLKVALLWMPFNALFTYLFLYGLLFWLFQMRYGWFWGGLAAYLLLCLGSNFLFRALVLIPYQTDIRLPPNNETRNQIFSVGSFIGTQAIVGVACGIKLLRHWYRKEQANQQLAHETLLVELQVLKARIHPHFLFNTLNNLYSLTLRRSPLAPGMILKLSELLHYMIYECNASTVALEKEITCLQNYVELEKLRYTKRLVITMNVGTAIDNQRIAPFLLIPFVENAFKHGSAKQTDHAHIELALSVVNNQLLFRLENSHDHQPAGNGYSTDGIGFATVRKRLQLIYPNAYDLVIRPEAKRFLVELTLDLGRTSENLQTTVTTV